MTNSIINIEEIIGMIPHRYPMLLVDRVIEISENGLVALKNVTINEPFFNGHFPGKPIMPGVLIIEAMAQASALFTIKALGEASKGKLVYFMSIDDAKFRKPVVPGDSLHIHTEKVQNRGAVWKFKCEGKVAGAKVAEATVTAMIAG